MDKYVYKRQDATSFGWEGIKGWSYSEKKDFERASAAYFEITDLRGHAQNSTSDRIYYIVEGEGNFIIEGDVHSVRETDVVIIPKNTKYGYEPKEGTTLKMFLVHTPSYEEESEVPEAVDLSGETKKEEADLLREETTPLV